MNWRRILTGPWDRIDDEMLHEEMNKVLSGLKIPAEQPRPVKFAQVPGAPPVRAIRRNKGLSDIL